MDEINSMEPKVSIIFICWNRKDDVDLTLNKLTNLKYQNKEIIVVDNGSEDNTFEMVKEKYSDVDIIRSEKNVGIAAYNIAAEKATGEYIIGLDDDSHIEDGAIEKTLEIFYKKENVGVIAYKVILPETGEVVTSDWKNDLTSFWGCGFAVRKKIIDEIGFYDEDLFLYTNEYDFSIRVRNLGYKIIYESNISAYHRVSSMNRPSGRLVELSVRNDIAFNIRYFRFPVILYTLPINLFNWFMRAILEGTTGFFFKGLWDGIKNISNYKRKSVKINSKTTNFYLLRHRNFENPIFKTIRKLFNGTLFRKVENV